MSGVEIGDVEVGPALFDFLRQVLAADEVGSGGLGVARLLALGEDGDGDVLAEPVGQRQGAAQLLVGVADVDAEQDVHLDGLVELGAGGLLDQRDRLGGRVGAVALDLVVLLAVSLAVGHRISYLTSTPIERAVPAMIFEAASRSLALRSGILRSAISRIWSWEIVPTLLTWGSPEPFAILIASLIRTAAGGVLVMKVKERSS